MLYPCCPLTELEIRECSPNKYISSVLIVIDPASPPAWVSAATTAPFSRFIFPASISITPPFPELTVVALICGKSLKRKRPSQELRPTAEPSISNSPTLISIEPPSPSPLASAKIAAPALLNNLFVSILILPPLPSALDCDVIIPSCPFSTILSDLLLCMPSISIESVSLRSINPPLPDPSVLLSIRPPTRASPPPFIKILPPAPDPSVLATTEPPLPISNNAPSPSIFMLPPSPTPLVLLSIEALAPVTFNPPNSIFIDPPFASYVFALIFGRNPVTSNTSVTFRFKLPPSPCPVV